MIKLAHIYFIAHVRRINPFRSNTTTKTTDIQGNLVGTQHESPDHSLFHLFPCLFISFHPFLSPFHLSSHPHAAHQASLVWLCADRKPTDKLPGHSEGSRASLHEALEQTLSQQIHSGVQPASPVRLVQRLNEQLTISALDCSMPENTDDCNDSLSIL